MNDDLDKLMNELLAAIEEVLYLELQYSDADIVDKLISIVEVKYDI
ncbi:hypothetical protein [Candidatus Xianfuyuplasma coldseepsis]|uniref:Uncharacterized protein n=1 Tax=Candidatus Xianfuyuplasma coldseepsis TaxID=2782163 RepID=A0A7L7KQL9_9MOLU|nr:hypothetical protein [Xianfuyuplasma coldseepsis]QMS85110.1 hypothetical protein G4Z02_04915 [Xianfuyuplasma coldseepsis]